MVSRLGIVRMSSESGCLDCGDDGVGEDGCVDAGVLRETDVVEKQRDCSSDCEARFDAEVSLGAGEIRLREDALENVLERTCAD